MALARSPFPFHEIAAQAANEAEWANENWPAWNSAHEGYAVILEELEELWQHVKTRQSERDLVAMRKEAIQLAACAIRFVHDVIDGDRGRR